MGLTLVDTSHVQQQKKEGGISSDERKNKQVGQFFYVHRLGNSPWCRAPVYGVLRGLELWQNSQRYCVFWFPVSCRCHHPAKAYFELDGGTVRQRTQRSNGICSCTEKIYKRRGRDVIPLRMLTQRKTPPPEIWV